MPSASTVVTSLVTAGLLVLLVILFRRKFRELRARIGDHGIDLNVECNPANMDLTGLHFPTSFYFPEDRDVPPPPSRIIEWWSWAHSAGGEDVGFTVVTLTIQASDDGPVSIEKPRIDCIHEDRVTGIIRGPEGMGGNGITPRWYRVELRGSGRVKPVYLHPPDERPPAFSIAKGDTQRIMILAQAMTAGRFEWTLDIPIIFNGRRLYLSANREGRSFVTIGSDEHGPPRLIWAWGQGHWIPIPSY